MIPDCSEFEGPDVSIRLPRQKWPKSWSNIEDPVVLLERNLHGDALAELFWKDSLRKLHWNWMGKSTELGMSFVYRKTKIIPFGLRG